MSGFVQKTVFISYRRVSSMYAQAIYENLSANGFDAFMDSRGLDSGAFGEILLRQIAARAHFVLLLTPGALDRCADKDDWLRIEIEHAISMKRNIVPITYDGFEWDAAKQFLIGKLAVLNRYNDLFVPAGYFKEAMERLRTQYLNIDINTVIHPTPLTDEEAVEKSKAEVEKIPSPSNEDLTIQQHLMLAHEHNRFGRYYEAIASATWAINLNENNPYGYIERGAAYDSLRQFDHALVDYNEAIQIDPELDVAFNNRGYSFHNKKQYRKAIKDYTKAISLNPRYAIAFNNRGISRHMMRQYKLAIDDYNAAIRLDKNLSSAYGNRGITYHSLAEYDAATADFTKAVELDPRDSISYDNRGAIFYIRHHYDLAIADYTSAINIEPNVMRLRMRARCFRKMDLIIEAEADEKEARIIEFGATTRYSLTLDAIENIVNE